MKDQGDSLWSFVLYGRRQQMRVSSIGAIAMLVMVSTEQAETPPVDVAPKARSVDVALKVMQKLSAIAAQGDQLGTEADRGAIVAELSRLNTVEERELVAKMCWAAIGSGDAATASYDRVLMIAFGRLGVELAGTNGAEALWALKRLRECCTEGGDRMILDELIEQQTDRTKHRGKAP